MNTILWTENLAYRFIIFLLLKPVVCTTGWITHGQSCYKFSSDRLNFNDAKEDCKNEGGYLVKIDDEDEEHLITLQQLRSEVR